jgi:hypothetical protein
LATTIKITDAGLGLITTLLLTSAYKYCGWGTGTTAAAHGDTALQTPAIMNPTNRVTGTQTQQTTNVSNDCYQVVATIATSGPLAITEFGIFDAAGSGSPPTGGNLFTHVVFDPINVTSSGDSIQFTIKHTFVSA